MKKTVYTKYSTERGNEFKIATSILKDKEGNKWVEKRAVHRRAQPHIESFPKKYQELSEYYKKTAIQPAPCEMRDSKAVFSFINGESLESRLDRYVEEKDFKNIWKEIDTYKRMITSGVELIPFRACDEFIRIFGADCPKEGAAAFRISDIDLIFSNIILSGDKWHVIDFEWTFDFPVPVDFIVYRAVKYYVELCTRRKYLTDNDIYGFLGMSERERALYDKMDDAFQAYVLAGQRPTWKLYESIRGRNVYLQDIVEKTIIAESGSEVQIFCDRGSGFTEEDSYTIRQTFDHPIELELFLQDNSKRYRIDPGRDFCIVRVMEALGNDKGFYALEVSSNGIDLGNGCYVFPTKDPQLYVSGWREYTDRIIIKLEVKTTGRELAFDLCRAVGAFHERIDRLTTEREELDRKGRETTARLERRIQETETELDRARVEIQQVNEKYQQSIGEIRQKEDMLVSLGMEKAIILNSTSWKITKPYRAAGCLIKKCAGSVLPRKVRKALFILLHYGFRECYRNVRDYRVRDKITKEYGLQITRYDNTVLKMQRKKKFNRNVLFSIIVPLYNTPLDFLKEMIESCQNQTYSDWELCLADGSDAGHREVGELVRQFASEDKRIRYQALEKNSGISENTNAAIDMAEGDYIALLDHDDLLHPSALYEYMCVIEEKNADFIYCDEMTFETTLDHVITMHFKPDFAIDNLRANNYICHFSVFSRELLERAGRFRKEYDGSQDHDMVLRLTEQAEKIVHVPRLLYFWRSHPQSVASDINSKTYAIEAGRRAVRDHLGRLGMEAEVESTKAYPTIFRIKYKLQEEPLISIIIPNKDHVDMLSRCIDSILNQSTYDHYEILIIENNSEDDITREYYKEAEKNPAIRVLEYNEKGFNYSRINNFAVQYAKGSYLLFLNNDIEIITPAWMEEMLMFAQRKDIAAVGAKLLYPNHTIQHAGIILGLGADRCAGVAHHQVPGENLGYMGRLYYAQDFSAVTAACLLVAKNIFEEVGGFDEKLAVAYNDVDLCLAFRQKGYLNVWNPYAEAYHHESVSRGYDTSNTDRERFENEVKIFREKWKDILEAGDPFYNPNLTLDKSDFSVISLM